jgi:16S rRNA G1207 methylase RsmC
MNPPFERGADIQHIEHARKFVKPGGRLVAICANGPRQRERLMPLATHWEDLPAGTFKAQGTAVNAALLVIDC